jgi:hypothetical protein
MALMPLMVSRIRQGDFGSAIATSPHRLPPYLKIRHAITDTTSEIHIPQYFRVETLNIREPCTEVQGLKLPSTKVDSGPEQSS